MWSFFFNRSRLSICGAAVALAVCWMSAIAGCQKDEGVTPTVPGTGEIGDGTRGMPPDGTPARGGSGGPIDTPVDGGAMDIAGAGGAGGADAAAMEAAAETPPLPKLPVDAGSGAQPERNYCDRSMWTATASAPGDGKGPPGAIDGDLTTRWTTGRMQDGTDWFLVDFGGLVNLSSIALNNTRISPEDYPGSYAVWASQDGLSFEAAPFAVGLGSVGLTVFKFSRQTARAVKISQIGIARHTNLWGIGEFQVTCSL